MWDTVNITKVKRSVIKELIHVPYKLIYKSVL